MAAGMPVVAEPPHVADRMPPTGGRQRVAALARLTARPAADAATPDPRALAPIREPESAEPSDEPGGRLGGGRDSVPDDAPNDGLDGLGDRPSAGRNRGPDDESEDRPSGGPDAALDRGPDDPGWARRLTESGPWDSLADRWVPEPLRGARIDPGRRGALLITAIAAVAAIAAAIGVWSTRPRPTAVDAVALPTSAAIAGLDRAGEEDTLGSDSPAADATPSQPREPAPPATTRTAPPSGPMMVSVTGDVRHPGLVTVSAGARVADAIAAAGGVTDPASLTGLNLAARLVDGASVVVGDPGGNAIVTDTGEESADVIAAAGGGAVVHLNSSGATALEALPGVGPVTAQAILTYRTEHGPFTDIAQLQEVSGIGPATFAKLAPHVAL